MKIQLWIHSLISKLKGHFRKSVEITDDNSNCLNKDAEEVLTYIVQKLKEKQINLTDSNITLDGRVNSSICESTILSSLEEGNIIEYLKNKNLKLYIPNIREWYDFLIYDKERSLYIPVNIKISTLNQADNVSSKKGVCHALTGIMPFSSIDDKASLDRDCLISNRWDDFYNFVFNNIDYSTNADYYFLVINKNDNSDIFYTSLKTLVDVSPNGNNLPFECNWGKNREENRAKNRTNKEACLAIINGFEQSLFKTSASVNRGLNVFKNIIDRSK